MTEEINETTTEANTGKSKTPWVIAVIALAVLIGGYVFSQSNKQAVETVEQAMDQNDANRNNTSQTDGTGTAQGELKTFTVEGSNFKFEPSEIRVKEGDKVKIVFKNTNGYHDFVVDEFGAATKQFQSPGEETIEFTANKKGTFEYYCSVGQHRAMGMKGNLIVE